MSKPEKSEPQVKPMATEKKEDLPDLDEEDDEDVVKVKLSAGIDELRKKSE